MTRITKLTLVTFLLAIAFVSLIFNALQKNTNQENSTSTNISTPSFNKSSTIPTENDASVKDGTFYQVTKVVDGDTFKIQDGTEEKTIRLIGLDTPETVHPSKPVECFGQEASAVAKQKLSNQKVQLIPDPTQANKDKYGRLLRYAYLEDGTLFNEWMIAKGYGFEYTYNTPYQFQEEFKEAEIEAEESEKGLWNIDTCTISKANPPYIQYRQIHQTSLS